MREDPPQMGPINTLSSYEGGIQVEIHQRCSRSLCSMSTIGNGKPKGSLLTSLLQEGHVLLSYLSKLPMVGIKTAVNIN